MLEPPPYSSHLPQSSFDLSIDDVAILVNLETPQQNAAGPSGHIVISAVHHSLLVLSPEGFPVHVEDALRVGDEIVSVDDEPSWHLGPCGVQALLCEAGADPFHISVRRAGQDAVTSFLVQAALEGTASVAKLQVATGARRYSTCVSCEAV